MNSEFKLIKGAKVVNQGIISSSDVLIKGEIIHKISSEIIFRDNFDLIDGKNKYLIPGCIDDQVHFREPGLTHKGTIESESKACIAGGITSFFEMPNTVPNTTNEYFLKEKLKIAKNTSWANFGFMLGGTNDNYDDILKTDKRLIPALKLFLGSSTGNMLVDNKKIIKKIFSNFNLPIAVHCEDEKVIKTNLDKLKIEFGDKVPMYFHPKIRSEEACYLSSSNAINLAKETGARLHVFHLSTLKETNLFDNKLSIENKKITSEVCVHHLLFNDDDYKTKGSLIKWNPAIKSESDRIGLWKALNDDRIDIIATDHAPHTYEEKKQDYFNSPSGGPMVQHGLQVMLDFVNKGKIPLEKVVEKMCHNPAILFSVERRGFIKEGYYADLVLIDLKKDEKILKENLLYKCGWSPLEGKIFKGCITHTIVNGHLQYHNGIFSNKRNAKQIKYKR